MTLQWNDKRVTALQTLIRLLQACSSIDSSNNIIDRLGRIILMAEALQRSNLATGDISFIDFLQKLAIADREKEKSKCSESQS